MKHQKQHCIELVTPRAPSARRKVTQVAKPNLQLLQPSPVLSRPELCQLFGTITAAPSLEQQKPPWSQDSLLCTHMDGKERGFLFSVYSSVFQGRRKNSHLSVMVVVWVSAGNDLGLLIRNFFHCKMISNALTQGEDPKNPEWLKGAVIAHNSHPLSSAKSKDKTFDLPTSSRGHSILCQV